MTLVFLRQAVLVVGNVLNSSTFRGSAVGFQLSDLLKLKDTKPAKSSQATPTLLHYLVRVLNENDKSLVGFLDDCAHVEAAARVSTQTLASSIAAMIAGHEAIVNEIDILQRSKVSPAGDRFLPTMIKFCKDTKPQIKALQSAGATTSADLTKLVTYFGEDANQTKPEDFFALIASFGQALMRAEVDVLEADRKAEEAAKKQAKAAARRGFFKQTLAPEVRGPLAALRENDVAEEAKAATEVANIAGTSNLPSFAPAGSPSLIAKEEELREAEDQFETNDDVTPTGSRFRSIGAASTIGRRNRNRRDPSLSSILAPDVGEDNMRRSYGRGRGHFDEALKELRSGARTREQGPIDSGRKSLRRADTVRERRPLSRVFLDGT